MSLPKNKPRLSYAGLTVVLSNPSRFDTLSLLSANGGKLFNDFCLQPDYNSMQIEVRLADDESPLLEGTKCLLICGEYATHKWLPETRGNALQEIRGGLYHTKNGIPAIPSFIPQEAADIKNYENEFNSESNEYNTGDDEVLGGEDEDDGDVKAMGATKRSNYAFWLRADVRKCKSILLGKLPERTHPRYNIYPSSTEVISALLGTKNSWLWFDMETDYERQNLLCFSFSFNGTDIYCVPILDYNYKWAYLDLHYIMRALCIAIKNNTIVAHNGAAFDFFVLAYKYGIPVNKCYDTMLAQHRCYPDIEKSLGHCVSLWTWERFHKDTDSATYWTRDDMMRKLQYCGKDVYTMFLVHKAIEQYAKTIPGLQSSIDAAMACIRPYLITSLQGIQYSEAARQKILRDNDIILNKYLMLIEYLVGPDCLTQIRGKGKVSALPNSNPQCVKYFHEQLGYPVVARGKPNKITGERKPSLAKKNLYKLQLKHDNPVLTLISAFRTVAKESSILKFIPWRDDSNNLIDYDLYIQKEQANKNNKGQTYLALQTGQATLPTNQTLPASPSV